jgi:hypothetical protein
LDFFKLNSWLSLVLPHQLFPVWVLQPLDFIAKNNKYKLLPNLHNDIDSNSIDKLADGGAAMTGYAKMQFMNISEQEHKDIANGLLRYCELDTMAMVFIYEYFKELTG